MKQFSFNFYEQLCFHFAYAAKYFNTFFYNSVSPAVSSVMLARHLVRFGVRLL